MSRINTNVNSLISQRILNQQNQSLTTSLERLSTGFRINRGADDPAGLIASESLRSEKAAISAAISNAERADQFLNVAEGGLQEVSSMLIELQGLVSESANEAGLSQEEKEANQQQIDGILQTIDRIASTTSFQGTKLLNGSFDFTVSAQDSDIVDLKLNAAALGSDNTEVQALVTQSAQQAGLFLSLGATSLSLSPTDDRFVFNLAGTDGNKEFSFASGTDIADIATQVNTFKGVTGISAAVSGNGIVFKSTEYGSNEFVSIDIVQDGNQAGSVSFLCATDANAASDADFTALGSFTNALRDEGRGFLVITHYQRLLDHIKPDVVHIMADGRIVKTGGPELALEVENNGYTDILAEVA